MTFVCTCGHDLGAHPPDPARLFAWPCLMCPCSAYKENPSLYSSNVQPLQPPSSQVPSSERQKNTAETDVSSSYGRPGMTPKGWKDIAEQEKSRRRSASQ